ncbi:MAG: class I SAM-dependent methyltransferase [Burkholderiales bacterium]|nr:class I SAM-dependent methyltransferase [Burkholderiales bacterium]
MTQARTCRSCGAALEHSFCDLGMSPPSNAYVRPEDANRMEPFYPLHAYVCGECFLVQLEQFQSPDEIFSDYAYFSSYSESWLVHCKVYTEAMIQRFGFDARSQVVEIASNDGYLLQYFKASGIPVLGIEPAANVAKVAEEKGIPSIVKFFGTQTAREIVDQGARADLLLGNNVLAHVPMLNDFVAGMKILLKPDGVITMEFPHLLRLMVENQFDTIYHEHFSYLSYLSISRVFERHGLVIFDVDEIPTHGGSLRIYARHADDSSKPISPKVVALAAAERSARLDTLSAYSEFAEQVRATKRNLLEFLIDQKRRGKSIVAYGAAAKGNTLLNYCGVRGDFLDYVVDRNPHKQGNLLPGTHIPILAPERIAQTRPDFVLILPWNIKDEVVQQMSHIRSWGGRFVVPIPKVEVLP